MPLNALRHCRRALLTIRAVLRSGTGCGQEGVLAIVENVGEKEEFRRRDLAASGGNVGNRGDRI